MSFWGRLFGAPDVVEKGVDAAIAGIDKTFYTDEEKADDKKWMREWILKYHEVSKGSNVARRVIAIMVIAVFLLLVLTAAVLIVVNALDRFDRMLELIADTLVWPVGIIMVFYFSIGVAREWPKKN